jgi:hypothetical protein
MNAEQMEAKKKERWNAGLTIMLLLGAATIGEFGIATVAQDLIRVTSDIGWVLMLVALFKAFLVVRDYMHVGRLFSGGEDH